MIPERLYFKAGEDQISGEGTASPSQQGLTEPAISAGFRFLSILRDKMGTNVKHSDYKPAKLYDKKEKWFVYYSFRNPETGEFKRFKVYEGINSIQDLQEKIDYGKLLVKAVDETLATGYNPFKQIMKVSFKTWTLNQGLNYFKQNLQTRGLRKRSIQTYESTLRLLYKELKPILQEDIKSITRQQLQILFNRTAESKGWSNTTFNGVLTQVKAIFNYLVQSEILEVSPAHKIKPLPESIKRNKYFDDKTFKKIREKADPELLDFILFLYHTGLRPNEARQIKHENINTEQNLLFVPSTLSKNKKDDYVPLTDYIVNKYGGKEGVIFGKSINYFTLKFNTLKKELKLPEGTNLYSVKHTRAVHLAQDGASPYAIMQLFRHSSLEITMKYLRDLGLTVNRESVEKTRQL